VRYLLHTDTCVYIARRNVREFSRVEGLRVENWVEKYLK